MTCWHPGQRHGIDATVYTHRDSYIYRPLYCYDESTAGPRQEKRNAITAGLTLVQNSTGLETGRIYEIDQPTCHPCVLQRTSLGAKCAAGRAGTRIRSRRSG